MTKQLLPMMFTNYAYKICSRLFLGCLLFLGLSVSVAQNPLDLSQHSVYAFLDELAAEHLIDINSAVKPFDRQQVAKWLTEVRTLHFDELNSRQRHDLDFFLNEFNVERSTTAEDFKWHWFPIKDNTNFSLGINPLGIFYKDSLFRVSAQPVIGAKLYKTPDDKMYHRWNGARINGYIGKHVSFYASLVDNYYSQFMTKPTYLYGDDACLLKGENNTDYADIRGGVFFAWKWGNIGILKDKVQWGSNENGASIFSGRQPSVAMVKVQIQPVKWLAFTYMHANLASDVVDSLSSYTINGHTRNILEQKFLAANFLTITPVHHLHLSFGNSIVYNQHTAKLQYCIPVLFYKAVDDVYNATDNHNGENAQMFLDISCRSLKHVHVYTTLYIDEIGISRMFDKNKQSNYLSWKIGGSLLNFPLPNLVLSAEYTRCNPHCYQHFYQTTDFTSSGVNMGSYLGDNAQEFFMQASYRPLSRLQLTASLTRSEKGTPLVYGQGEPWGIPFMAETVFTHTRMNFKADYELLNNVHVFAELHHYKNAGETQYITTYAPLFFSGTSGNTLAGGLAIGF